MNNLIKSMAKESGWEIIPDIKHGIMVDTKDLLKAPDGVMMFVEGLSGNPVYYPLLQQSTIEKLQSRKINKYRVDSYFVDSQGGWACDVYFDKEVIFSTGFHKEIIYSKAIALTYIFEKEQK